MTPDDTRLPEPYTEPTLADFPDEATIFAKCAPSHAAFVRYYVANGGNMAQAAAAAGFERHHANRVFDYPEVQEAYTRWSNFVFQRAAISTEQILGDLRTIADHDAEAIFEPGTLHVKPISEWPERHRRMVQKIRVKVTTRHSDNGTSEEVQTEVEFPDRLKAYELLGKHKRLWEADKSRGKKTILVINNPPPGHGLEQYAAPAEIIEAGAFQIQMPPKPKELPKG